MAGVIELVDAPVVLHLCGDVDWRVLRRTGADGVLLDATRLTPADFDGVGELAESGALLGLGSLDPRASRIPDAERLAAPAVRLFGSIGLPAALLARTTVTPTCGLAGASEDRVRPILAACASAARLLATDAAELLAARR